MGDTMSKTKTGQAFNNGIWINLWFRKFRIGGRNETWIGNHSGNTIIVQLFDVHTDDLKDEVELKDKEYHLFYRTSAVDCLSVTLVTQQRLPDGTWTSQQTVTVERQQIKANRSFQILPDGTTKSGLYGRFFQEEPSDDG